MTTGAIIRLVLQALIFTGWAFMMFRTMFMFRSRDLKETGRMFHGPGGFIRQLGYWLRSDEDRRDRRLLLGFTLALFASIAVNALTISQ